MLEAGRDSLLLEGDGLGNYEVSHLEYRHCFSKIRVWRSLSNAQGHKSLEHIIHLYWPYELDKKTNNYSYGLNSRVFLKQ